MSLAAAKTPAVGIVLLAAGASARMGRPKQLLRYRGQTLVRRSVEASRASVCSPVVVVLGCRASEIRRELEGANVIVADNVRWAEGIGSSVATGVDALLAAAPESAAIVLAVCDQPCLAPAVIDALAAAHDQSPDAIVAARYDGIAGVPALFPRSLFGDLRALRGADGARSLLRTHCLRVIELPFPDGSFDIDTPDDYASLLRDEPYVPAPVMPRDHHAETG
jgi:molybdenum cofactor cytidylyltransferase